MKFGLDINDYRCLFLEIQEVKKKSNRVCAVNEVLFQLRGFSTWDRLMVFACRPGLFQIETQGVNQITTRTVPRKDRLLFSRVNL